MVVCPYCTGPHPLWECRKKPEGWKPPKKSTEPIVQMVERPRSGRVAGSNPAREGEPLGSRLNEGAREVPVLSVDTKRPRGRPRTGFDKKAYDRNKAAERRANKKAKEAAK